MSEKAGGVDCRKDSSGTRDGLHAGLRRPQVCVPGMKRRSANPNNNRTRSGRLPQRWPIWRAHHPPNTESPTSVVPAYQGLVAEPPSTRTASKSNVQLAAPYRGKGFYT